MEKRFRIHPQLLPWLMGGGIVLLNLLLKLWQAGETSLYLDEGASIFYAQMDGDAFAAFLNQDASPPLYYWLLHGWMAIVGDDLGVLRGLSGAISSLAAIGIFALGKRFFSNYAGLLAALLFTFSNLHFQYAQEVRCYALLGMLSVWSMYFLLGMVRDRRWSDFLGLMLVNLGILGTHYAGFALLLAQGLIMLAILPFDFKRVLRYALSQMPLLALALILILKDVNADKLGATSWLTAPKAPMLLKILSPFSGNSFMALAIICVFAIGMGALLWQWRQGETAAGKKLRLFLVLLAWPLLGLLVAWLISQWMPFFIAKYLAHIGIGWLVAAAIAVGQLPFRRWGKWAVGLFLLCGTLFLFKGKKTVSEDWKRAAIVAQHFQQNGGLFITPSYQLKSMMYYLDRDAFRDYKDIGTKMYKRKILGINKIDKSFFSYQDYDRCLLMQSHLAVSDPGRESKRLLAERLILIGSINYKGIEISLFDGRKPSFNGETSAPQKTIGSKGK